MKKINENYLDKMLSQINDLDGELLLSGLTIISKDLSEYTAARGLNSSDVNTFRDVYFEVLNNERNQFEKEHNPLFEQLGRIDVPNGIAKEAESEKFDLSVLTNPELNREYFRLPGNQILKKFGKKFKETICGKGGPYEQFNSGDGLLNQADLPKAIAASILASPLTPATFWYPLAVYIGLLISKITLKAYCENDELNTGVLIKKNNNNKA